MAKIKGRVWGFRFPSTAKLKQLFVHPSKIGVEDARDARIADAAYEAYLKDPSGARPLDELIVEWEAMDAKRENAKA